MPVVTFGVMPELDDLADVDAERRSAGQSRTGSLNRLLRPAQMRSSCVGRRRASLIDPTDEGGHGRRAGRGRSAEADQLQHGAVADVGRTRRRDPARRSRAPGRWSAPASRCHSSEPASLIPNSVPLRAMVVTIDELGHLGRPPGEGPGRGHASGQEEEVVGRQELGDRRRERGRSEATRWGSRLRSSRLVLAWTRMWTSSPICTPWAARPRTSIGPCARRASASSGPATSGQEPQAIDGRVASPARTTPSRPAPGSAGRRPVAAGRVARPPTPAATVPAP